jgi:hypothetical protein
MSAASQIGWRRYDEIVERVNAPHKYTILLREHPLYLQGYGPVRHRARYRNSVPAPSAPLYDGGPRLGLGASPVSTIVGGGGSVAAAYGAAPLTSAIGLSTAAIPVVGAAIAAGVAIFAGLWAAHERRLKEAQNENQAVNQGVAGVDEAVKTINQAYNSGQATAAQCIQALEQVEANFWSEVAGVIQPGRNACEASPSGSANCDAVDSQTACSGGSGAACCVGCSDLFSTGPQPANIAPYGSIYYGIAGAIICLQQGGGQSLMQQIVASKYGVTSRAAYTLNWQAPPASTSAPGTAVSNVASNLATGVVTGITSGVSDVAQLAGTGSPLLLLAAAALAAYLFL